MEIWGIQDYPGFLFVLLRIFFLFFAILKGKLNLASEEKDVSETTEEATLADETGDRQGKNGVC